MNDAAVDYAAEEWSIDEGRQPAADRIVNESCGEGDQEVKEEACGCRFISLLKRWGTKCSAGDGLKEALDGDTVASHQGRGSGKVESAGDQTCQCDDFEACDGALPGVLGASAKYVIVSYWIFS